MHGCALFQQNNPFLYELKKTTKRKLANPTLLQPHSSPHPKVRHSSSGRPFGLTKSTFQLRPAIWAHEIRHSSSDRPFGPTRYDIPASAGHSGRTWLKLNEILAKFTTNFVARLKQFCFDTSLCHAIQFPCRF